MQGQRWGYRCRAGSHVSDLSALSGRQRHRNGRRGDHCTESMASARDGDDLADHRGVFRYSSLASIAAAVFAPFYSAFGWGFDARFAALVVIAGLTVYRHRVNIRHLIAGTERRIGDKGAIAVKRR